MPAEFTFKHLSDKIRSCAIYDRVRSTIQGLVESVLDYEWIRLEVGRIRRLK